MHSVKIINGLTPEMALTALAGSYAHVFSDIGLDCLRIRVSLRRREIQVIDPHKHLADHAFRQLLRESIDRQYYEPEATFIRQVLLGDPN